MKITQHGPVPPRIVEILGKINYKKDWELRVQAQEPPGRRDDLPGTPTVVFRITAPIVEVNTGQQDYLNSQGTFLPWNMDEEDIVKAVFMQIQSMEVHECAEWFNYNSFRVFDPHVNYETKRGRMELALQHDLIPPDVQRERELVKNYWSDAAAGRIQNFQRMLSNTYPNLEKKES